MNKRLARSAVALAVAGSIVFGGSAAFAGGPDSAIKDKTPNIDQKVKVKVPTDKVKELPPDVEVPSKVDPGKLPPLDPCIDLIVKKNPKLGDLIKQRGFITDDIRDQIEKIKDKIKLPKICPPDENPPKDPPKEDPPKEDPPKDTPTDTPTDTKPQTPDTHTVEVSTPAPVVYYSTPSFTG